MIRLITTDMDGTLLDDDKQLPQEFDWMLQRLYEQDIHFAIASGRSYATLKQQFKDYLDEMTFICDNGAYVVNQQNIISLSIMDKEEVEQLIRVCRSFEGKILLCGMNATYHEYFGSEEYEAEIANYYVNQVLVEDNLKVQDDIFKIALFDEQGAEEHAYPILEEHFEDRLNFQVSGKHWIDIMNKGVNKGYALRKLQKALAIETDQTMAFGDYLNDYELLKEAGESYAMANAHEEIKNIAKYITLSNNEQGVVRTIKSKVFGEKI